MKHLEPQFYNILNKLGEYARQPSAYRVCVLCGAPLSGKTTVAKELSEKLGGKYIDVLKDELGELEPGLPLYKPNDFKRDMGRWSKEIDSLLVVDEVEPLLDTWPREEQKNLFKLVSKWRTDCVILIVTRFNLPYEDFLGKERVFRLGKLGEGTHVE
jgi:hypothetical protein